MNKIDDKPNKNSLNLLAYFGKRKFDVRFFAIYLTGVTVLCIITNFILDGGNMTAYGWWFSIIAGLLIGAVMYFWDLNKSRKHE